MGMRAHVRIKNIVEFDYNGAFNYEMDNLCDLLEERGCDTSYTSDEDGNLLNHWELKTDEVKSVINSLKEEEPTAEMFNGYTARNIIKVLESWVATVEDHPENYSNTDYIDIDWF